jgi:hypothetical protein
MVLDSIVAEIRQVREELAKRFNYDLRAIIEDARNRQMAGGRKVVSLPRRPVRKLASVPVPPVTIQQRHD